MADDDAKQMWVHLEDETFFLGAVPLHKFKQCLQGSQKEAGFDTSTPGYCTDAVLKVWRDVYLTRLQQDANYKSQLKKIDLRCCSLVTDVGIGWLAEIVKYSPHLNTIQIDGCTKVTDCGLSALKLAAKSVQVSAMATSVTHLNLGNLTTGCPLLIDTKNDQTEAYLQGHVLVVPHDQMKASFSEYLKSKTLVQREILHHITDWTLDSWNIAVTEIPYNNPLFESLVSKNPTQVIIPFDASLELTEIKSHIAKTITRILSKETVNPPHKDLELKINSSALFLDTQMVEKCVWNPDGLFRSLSHTERVIGCHMSRQPLSRTNCYFEVECVSKAGTQEIAIVMGIVHDVLFSDRHPMESNEKSGGAVEGFDFQVGDVIRFGIEGSWESEYVPMDHCSFYFTRNGSKCLDKTLKERPHCGMYPLVSVIGQDTGEIRLKNYAAPPDSLKKRWVKLNQYIEPAFCHCMLWDEHGILTYGDDYKNAGDVGLFVSRHVITWAYDTCTIAILDTGEKGTISIGVGPEDYKIKNQPGWLHPSVGFHGDDGSIFLNNDGEYTNLKVSEPWKKGDVIKVVVTGFSGEIVGDNEEITVTFYKNNEQEEVKLMYKKPPGIRCVFLIGMHSPGEKVKILNFRRPYKPDPPVDDKLTMGRCNFINVYDDGTLAYYKFDKREPFGLFVSKTPISGKLQYFEMKVLKSHVEKHIGIGLCHRDYKINEMPGWLAGSVGYHADNGHVYANAVTGVKTIEQNPDKIMFGEGDIVGCGVEAVFKRNKLKPQQTIKVYFTKNGTRVHEVNMDYVTDGLYPCVGLHFEDDQVQLYNFFPLCQRVIQESPAKTEHETEANMPPEGCQFVVVAVSDGTSDAKEKVELVKQHLDLSKDLDLIADLEQEVERLDRDLESLRVQGQQYYSSLGWQLECLKRIAQQPDRVRFLAVDTSTGQGHEDLVNVILSNQTIHRELYPKLYELHASVKTKLETIISLVQSRGVIPISELQEATGRIFGESSHLYIRAVKYLHKKGQLVYLPSRISHLALDTMFVKKRLQIGVGIEPNEQVGKRVACVGETTQVWTKNVIGKLLKEQGKNMHTVLVYLGIMRLPCIRTKPDDPFCLFTTLDKLQPTEAKLTDFWSDGKELENTILMSRCYKFPNGLPPSLLSATMTLCSFFSRPILLTPEGGVYQSGAVQTVIIKHLIEKGEAVTIESKCFSPPMDNAAIDDDTSFHIEEYTWQVFCIFSDIFDFYITNQGLVTIIHENTPHWFVNSSIGCSHDWSYSDALHPQTVCTMCNLCCDRGNDCEWSGILGQYLRECRCGTKVNGCKQCGICKRCADELWQIRSFLRPCLEVSRPSKTGKHSCIPMNGITSSEVECINLDVFSAPLCLHRQHDTSGALIQVFPGPAVKIPTLQEMENYNEKNRPSEPRLRFEQGDVIKIRLTEIPRTKQVASDVEEEDVVVEVKPVYYTAFCRELRVWHDSGILCYDSLSPSIPVGQFCAARPLTSECNKFSLEIVNPGDSRTIAIGLCHRRYLANRQPGWDPSSIAYHADDGGIFIGSGWALHSVGEVFTGDRMTCQLDMDSRKVSFYLNDKQVYESNKLRIPAGGFHPMIGLHSTGEAVRLLEKDPWLPPKEGDIPPPPLAFDSKKYGNLWISPGRTLFLLKRKGLHGWLLLHNPSRELIGFMITASVGSKVLEQWSPTGSLEPHKSHCIRISLQEAPSIVDIVWFSLELGKQYSQGEIEKLCTVLTPERLHSHSLRVHVADKQLLSVTHLRVVGIGEPQDKDVYTLEVLKNGGLVQKYWLHGGAYHCIIPKVKPEDAEKEIFLRYPKAPTFDQPNMFQKGMRIVAQPYENVYAECMIIAVSRDGKCLTLEYSPKDSDENLQMDLNVDSDVIQLKNVPLEAFEDVREKMEILRAQNKTEDKKNVKKPEDGSGDKPLVSEEGTGDKSKDTAEDVTTAEPDDLERSSFTSWGKVSRKDKHQPEKETSTEKKMKADIEVLGYESRGNFSVEKRAYIFPPLQLLTESSQFAIFALDSNWRENSLISQSKCQNIPTRVTVQEQQIVLLSRDLPSWVRGSGKDGKIDQAYAFLPQNLNRMSLCHPSVMDMFENVDVHRLCFLVDQVYFAYGLEQFLDIPIHFVNIPPITPKYPLPPGLMFGNIFSGWTYTALIATKLLLPVCDRVFPNGQPDFSREQLEVMMHQLVQVYAAQCHVMAEQYGSLQFQQVYDAGTTEVNHAIAHSDVNVKTTFDMQAATCLFRRRFRNHCLCKTHLWTLDKTITDEIVNLTMDYFVPYEETVNCFARDARDLYITESLPQEMFTQLSNLQYFSLDLFEKMKELPAGISNCKRLNTVKLSNMALRVLPPDIFKTPNLEELTLKNLFVKSLPTEWPVASKLTRLTLSGLQLELLPPEISSLQELVYLDLNYNPLKDLPMELEKLQKLKYLSVCGVPWISLELNRTITLDIYTDWFSYRPYYQHYFTEQKLQQMFSQYDVSKNGTLGVEEIAAINLQLFWDIPRIGAKNLNDEEYGGIPPVIFLLTSLEELYLDHQAIVAVPAHMCRLVNLCTLCLAHNPLLESLPGSLGHLPNIRSIDLMSCPSLRTPPNEVVSRGFESVKAYLKRLAGGFTECRRTKLMFVGLGGAGKTSLLKALMSSKKRTDGTKGEDITDGIVIQPWTIKNSDGLEVTYNTWDFAGQTLYYNTHQFFLSKRAIYLLLWSTRQGFEHAGLDFWLSSVACHAPHTPIFVVGTHCDQVPKADVPQDQLRERYPQIVGFHFISSVEGKGIAELQEKMLEVTLAQKNMGEKIPQVWLSLEQRILKDRATTSILEWKVIKEYGMDVGIYDEKDIREAIQFLHELGTVQYFDNDFLRDHVVINPQWIVNVMSCVVSVKNSPIQDKKGRFEHVDIPTVWSSYPPSLHKWLLQLTEEFDLTFPIPKEPVNIVPCLLPHEVPKDLKWPSIEGQEGIHETKIVYKFAYLPAGLFNRAQVRLFQFSDSTLIWKWGSLLNKNNHLALIQQTGDSELVVKVQGPRPENVIFLVHEIFESLIEESFHGVVYHFLVPCPDCVLKEGTLEPSLFESELISHAKDCKAPFLQCHKYFHTVSMGQLQDAVPDVSDFDTQLYSRIIALQQLNDDRTTDVAVLYSAMDVPHPGQSDDTFHPVSLKTDLELEKFSVWFPDNIQNISVEDLVWGIKNSKVVVALVSDNFERDDKCCDMLWYTMNSLKKDYVIAVTGTSMAWQNTDMGMRIGKQEIMVMIKTKTRYAEKKKELISLVKSKLTQLQEMANKDHHSCFISYCWSNSRDAVEKGTKSKEGSVGWGDPRVIKKYLQDKSISTWIDHEETMCGGAGLFQRLAKAIRDAKVFVACVSDEYADSENCMMELRFAVLNVGLPLVLCIVGTKRDWEMSEIGILAQRSRAAKVFFQNENPEAFDTLLRFVKSGISSENSLLGKEKAKQERSELKKIQASKNTNVSFQEEYELIQRKFMRHIISFISISDSSPMPRLIVLDFDAKAESNLKQTYMARDSCNIRGSSFGRANLNIVSHNMQLEYSNYTNLKKKSKSSTYDEISEMSSESPVPKRGLRPKSLTRSRERMEPFIMDEEEDTWKQEAFCIKILCEHEEGWHECKKTYPFRKGDDFIDTLQRLAPYLFRLYSILKQSSVQLNCLAGEYGTRFQEWIDKESQHTDFLESFKAVRDIIPDDEEASEFLQQLSRCHLPSGKIYWLCDEHQSGPRITKLSLDIGTSKSQRKVVFPEDTAFKEIMEKSDIFRKRKAEKSKPSVILPPVNNVAVIPKKPLDTTDLRRPSAFERADAGIGFKPQHKKFVKATKSQPSITETGPSDTISETGTGDKTGQKTVVFSDKTGDSKPSKAGARKPAATAADGPTVASSSHPTFQSAATVAGVVTAATKSTSKRSVSKTCAIQ